VAVSAEMSPRLQSAFAALRQESSTPPRPAAMAMARAVMHQARVARPRTRVSALPLFTGQLRRAFTTGRMMAAGGGLATGLAAVSVLGWNAPAGTPLHVVRLAHEQIALAVPGVDRTGLELSYAESRLQDAVQGTSRAASLDEASRLLADAHGQLPADHGSAVWSRWQDDQKQLDGLREQHGGEDIGAPGGGSLGAPASPGGSNGDAGGDVRGGAPAPASPSPAGDDGGHGSSAPAPGGEDGAGGVAPPSPSGAPDDGHRSSTSTSTSSTTHSGDHGGSSSSSTTTTTSHGGSSSVATTTTTTTTSTTSRH
jgi:hypothetical protein